MASTDRRVTRREPITVKVDVEGQETTFLAHPLPWKQRNDFGNLVLSEYSDAITRLLDKEEEDGVVKRLTPKLFESVMDYPKLFAVGFAGVQESDFEKLDFDQMLVVLGAALEVNGLERYSHMLDPDRVKDPATGVSEVEAPAEDGSKMESSTASG